MGDENHQSLSVSWFSSVITSNVAADATQQYPLTLNAGGLPPVTITVLLPILSKGILYSITSNLPPGQQPQNQTWLPPASTTATVDGFLLSVNGKENPPQILFQASVPVSTPAASSPPTSNTGAIVSSTTPATPASTSSQATRTAPSKSPPPTTSVPILPQSEEPELSTGSIAGIAVGCLFAGALLAGIISWFCWRRKKGYNAQYVQGSTYAMASQEKGFPANALAVNGTGLMEAGSRGGLPQPLEDKAISGDISKISNAIKNHVQSYYHTSRVAPGLIDYEDLHTLGPNLPISVGTLTTLIGNAATREIALRFIIAWVVVGKLQPSRDPSKSLLPSEVAQCYQAIATGERGYQAQASLMARWRVMTAELMQSSYIRNPFGPLDSRHTNIQATLATLDNVLQPYADSRMNNGERKRNLEELLKRAALFAFTLFSQPSAWEFEWQEEQGVTSGELCIFPALVQVADEAGHPVSPPRPFSEGVVRRLDA